MWIPRYLVIAMHGPQMRGTKLQFELLGTFMMYLGHYIVCVKMRRTVRFLNNKVLT